MISNLAQIGDEVTITIPKDNRDWGYNPCPDGTKATIIGFSEMTAGRINNNGRKPGVYRNTSWATLRLEDQGAAVVALHKEYRELTNRLDLIDQVEYQCRLEAFRAQPVEHTDDWRITDFLRDLPETPFWEGDFVKIAGRSLIKDWGSNLATSRDPEIYQIIRINYSDRANHCAYDISDKLGSGWHTNANQANMTLIERGPVWRYYHGEAIAFVDIREEADFFQRLGRTRDVRNPANGLYKWTKDEVLEAIQRGTVHSFSVASSMFGGNPSIHAIRFIDEGLGKRVAQATLVGFGLATV